jgi:hypothetical protein
MDFVDHPVEIEFYAVFSGDGGPSIRWWLGSDPLIHPPMFQSPYMRDYGSMPKMYFRDILGECWFWTWRHALPIFSQEELRKHPSLKDVYEAAQPADDVEIIEQDA